MIKAFLHKWLGVPEKIYYPPPVSPPALTKFEAEELWAMRGQLLTVNQKFDALAKALGVVIIADCVTANPVAIIAREDAEMSKAEAKRRLDMVITGNSFMRALEAVMQNFPSAPIK